MEIDESKKEKSLLNLEKVMNKRREQMEKVVALVLLAYAIGLLVGEAIRDQAYGGNGGGGEESDPHPHPRTPQTGKKWKLYSGLFVLLRQKIRLGRAVLRQLIAEVLGFQRRMVWGDVRSHV